MKGLAEVQWAVGESSLFDSSHWFVYGGTSASKEFHVTITLETQFANAACLIWSMSVEHSSKVEGGIKEMLSRDVASSVTACVHNSVTMQVADDVRSYM